MQIKCRYHKLRVRFFFFNNFFSNFAKINDKNMERIVGDILLMSANVADDAVGMPEPEKKNWYIAIVGHRTERMCSKRLTDLGYQSYVASQWEVRRWRNGRTQRAERIVLPARVFVRATEYERLRHIVNLPYINRFVTDPARKETPDSWAPVAVIPDQELDAFRRMLGQDELPVFLEDSRIQYTQGERVRVTAGQLAGMEGIVRIVSGDKRRLCISLDILGHAFVEIDKNFIEPVLA